MDLYTQVKIYMGTYENIQGPQTVAAPSGPLLHDFLPPYIFLVFLCSFLSHVSIPVHSSSSTYVLNLECKQMYCKADREVIVVLYWLLQDCFFP